MNVKKQRVQFVNDVKAHLISIGAILTSDDSVYTLNECTIHIESEEEHKHVYSIFCRFDECNTLTGSLNSKHNYHGIDGQGWKEYLNEIKNFFN